MHIANVSVNHALNSTFDANKSNGIKSNVTVIVVCFPFYRAEPLRTTNNLTKYLDQLPMKNEPLNKICVLML